jgi:hypothetical protein
MEIKNLSNNHLVERLNKLVRTERKITHLVLECIAEIDRRHLYLEKAYSSLYDYLINEFGYSPSAAIRRIESARLLREIPEMAKKIEAGSLNLSQLSKVQQAIRTVQKSESRKMDTQEKREILEKIENTNQETTERILAQELNLPVQILDKVKINGDESVTLTMTFNKEQMELLNKVQDMIAHTVTEKKWPEVMTYLAQKELDRRTKIRRVSEKFLSKDTKMPPFKRLPIRPSLRKSILNREACCEFRDAQSGKLCGSTRFLQIDHVQPVWAGGGNESENLRTLCSQHNRYKYRREVGLHP